MLVRETSKYTAPVWSSITGSSIATWPQLLLTPTPGPHRPIHALPLRVGVLHLMGPAAVAPAIAAGRCWECRQPMWHMQQQQRRQHGTVWQHQRQPRHWQQR
jgi:hypothetical protein